uniref:Uncharacterized protein n=1 Tax=Cucumis melo TaxID=3656 RepID=A0A9I9ECA5_CUCME
MDLYLEKEDGLQAKENRNISRNESRALEIRLEDLEGLRLLSIGSVPPQRKRSSTLRGQGGEKMIKGLFVGPFVSLVGLLGLFTFERLWRTNIVGFPSVYWDSVNGLK